MTTPFCSLGVWCILSSDLDLSSSFFTTEGAVDVWDVVPADLEELRLTDRFDKVAEELRPLIS